MKMQLAIIVVLAGSFASCTSLPVGPPIASDRRSEYFEQCRGAVPEDMRRYVGKKFIDCAYRDGNPGRWDEAVPCVNAAFRRKHEFVACAKIGGFDSDFTTGVVGLPNGDLAIYYYDTWGPAGRGICPRESVLMNEDVWPTCGRSLLNHTEMFTERGPSHPPPRHFPYAENWTPECAFIAPKAVTYPLHFRTRPMRLVTLVVDSSKYGLPCLSIRPMFELVVDQTGSVPCARVLSATEGQPPIGLYDEIRHNLMSLRFEPPTVNRTSVEYVLIHSDSASDVCAPVK